jgi:hypothetical protein
MSAEEIIEALKLRITILVNEVEVLTEVVSRSHIEQKDLAEQHRQL